MSLWGGMGLILLVLIAFGTSLEASKKDRSDPPPKIVVFIMTLVVVPLLGHAAATGFIELKAYVEGMFNIMKW